MSQHELEHMIEAWNAWLKSGSTSTRDVALSIADEDRREAEKPTEPRCKVCGRINPCPRHSEEANG